MIEAVLDERTTPICRYLHGKTFTVARALSRFEELERMDRPEDIKDALPWVRQRLDPETGRTVLYVDRASGRTPIAEVVRSAFGSRGDRGDFRALTTDQTLGEVSGLPPFHGMCRTVTLALF